MGIINDDVSMALCCVILIHVEEGGDRKSGQQNEIFMALRNLCRNFLRLTSCRPSGGKGG